VRLKSRTSPSLARGGTGGSHARTARTCSSRSEISGCYLRCVTQAGNKLRLHQPRIQGPPLSAGGTPAACAAADSALPSVHPARSPPPRSPSVPPPPHAARRGDLEGLPIGLKPRPYGLCADSAGRPLPRSGGPALGSARIHEDHGPPFDTASEQDRPTQRNNQAQAPDSKPHGQCGLRGLVRSTVVFARCTELRQRL
jgi:hypothetical protein